MKLKMALAGILAAGFALPAAWAQTTVVDSYYVVQDSVTKKCTVSEKKPETTTTTKITVIGDKVYKTKTEAEGAMKTITTCTTQ